MLCMFHALKFTSVRKRQRSCHANKHTDISGFIVRFWQCENSCDSKHNVTARRVPIIMPINHCKTKSFEEASIHTVKNFGFASASWFWKEGSFGFALALWFLKHGSFGFVISKAGKLRLRNSGLRAHVWSALQTRENLPVVLRATYPENRVALTKY